MSSSSATSQLDRFPPSSEQLCYVHCNLCDTVLAVSVPCTSLFETVTVRCGHCTNLLPVIVNVRGLLQLPSPNHPFHPSHNSNFFSPPHQSLNLLDEMPNSSNQHYFSVPLNTSPRVAVADNELPRPPPINRQPPEKRQRVPSAYNRFIKEEIQRIKSANPDITHREAFSEAAKNWAHFPHIHFGLMPDQSVKKTNVCQQEGNNDVRIKDNNGLLFSSSPNNDVGVSPY